MRETELLKRLEEKLSDVGKMVMEEYRRGTDAEAVKSALIQRLKDEHE